jgi:hypothetical protein
MMTVRLIWVLVSVLVVTPALLGAQAKGVCPGSVGPDSALQGYVSKPDKKPRRKHDGVVPTVQDGSYSATMPQQADRSMNAESLNTVEVTLIGVVDTTGQLEPTSVMIAESNNVALSQAVCTAALQMQFDPGMKGGQKVAAWYKEQFEFYRQHKQLSSDDQDRMMHPHAGGTPPRVP